MKKGITQALSIALLGGALALWGCEKAVQPEPNQAVARSAPQLVAAEAARETTPAQAAWLRFVERVERGELSDPVGQYVAKGTKAEIDAQGHRLARPKVDVSLRDASKGYALRTTMPGATTAGRSIDDPCAAQEVDPCAPCYVGSGGCGGGGQGVVTTFVTSENQGGAGYIHDLKIVVGEGSSVSAQIVFGRQYGKLDTSLNQGAGGNTIFLCYTRDPANVLNGLEYTYNYSYSGPNEVLAAFETKYGSLTVLPQPSTYFYNIWVPNQNQNVYWGTIDLNAGAGGDYIYSYQSKNVSVSNYLIREVAILSGNASTINPPMGWIKYPRDLNEGAGGDYIYFCYR